MRKLGCILLVVMLALVSCTKASQETMYANQENKIATFINNMLRDTTLRFVNNHGAYRVTRQAGSGDALVENGNISFYYAGYTFNGSVSSSNLFATNHLETARKAGWNVSDSTLFQVLTVCLKEADFVEGLKNGLLGIQGGENAYVLFSGKYGFGNQRYGIIPANSALVYEIWAEAVTNNE